MSHETQTALVAVFDFIVILATIWFMIRQIRAYRAATRHIDELQAKLELELSRYLGRPVNLDKKESDRG